MLNRKNEPRYIDIQPLSFKNITPMVLPNGIEVHVLNGGSQELTKIDFLFDAGTRNGHHPLQANYTASMMNEGTQSRKAFEIAETFDYYGAHFTPVAEKDGATVSLIALNKHLDKTSELVADILTHSVFPEHELHTMAAKGKQNFLVDSEKTSFMSREYFYENLFGPHHYYGVRHKAEYFEQLNSPMLNEFYERFYRNSKPKLVVSGQITDAVLNTIERHFGHLDYPNTPIERTEIKAINTDNRLKVVEKAGAVQSSLRCGFLTVNRNHPDYAGLKILTTILGGYFGSRLMKNIREDKGFTYGIHAAQSSLRDAGLMVIGTDVKSDCSKAAMVEIELEIEKLKTDLVSAEELQLVRNFMMGDILQMFDGPLATSDAYKTLLPYSLGFEYFNQMQTSIAQITPKTLRDLAQKYYDTHNMVKIVVGVY